MIVREEGLDTINLEIFECIAYLGLGKSFQSPFEACVLRTIGEL